MRYGLIGGRLGHSYSRDIHARLGSYGYELRELAPDELAPFLAARDFCAVNVTIPYKQAVIPLLDEVSDVARRIGAVNVVVNDGGRLLGDNTDAAGFAALLRHAGVSVRGRKCLVLGTGGTSRTVEDVLRQEGAAQVVHVSRVPKAGAVGYDEAARRHGDAQVLVNTTPVGMAPDVESSPIDLAPFGRLEGVVDVVYHPLRTQLVLEAQRRGIRACGGLAMLVAQAVYASALFRGVEAGVARIDAIYRELLAEKRNIVLVGMPSSGKTTVGKLVAERSGRRFVDTDALAVERAGCSIAELFATRGEGAFRELERSIVAEVSQGAGQVVATGGGVVLDGRNVDALRRDGCVFFLDRPLEKLLATEDRPLSRTPEAVHRLYDERLPLYRAAADHVMDASRTPDDLACDILERSDR